jgi:hypothetical protein
MRVRVLAYYHDLIGKLLAEGQKPTNIHRCLAAEGVRVSLSGVKQYIQKYPKYPAARDIYLHGCQKVTVPGLPSTLSDGSLGQGTQTTSKSGSTKAVGSRSRSLAPYLTKLVQTSGEGVDTPIYPVQNNDSSLWQVKKEWWSDLRDVNGQPIFTFREGRWVSSGLTPDLGNIGLYAYIGAHLYARTLFPEEIRRELQRISMQISGRVTLNLTQKLSEGKILFGFVPTFAKRDRGMDEWQKFQRLPRAWRRKIIVEGTLGGYFLPLSMAWVGGDNAVGEAPLLDEPEYVLPEEFKDPTTQKLVPPEYMELLIDKDKLTHKLYWKSF